jgi:prepilin-type N-terminal cleavage/methylation domain-containing protein
MKGARAPRVRSGAMKHGFTLPEVLVAVLVFAVGILGLASSGTYIAMQAGEARAMTEGAILVGRVLDSLRSIPCATVASGQLTQSQATVTFTATPASRSVAVDATLQLTWRRGPRQWRVNTLIPCER